MRCLSSCLDRLESHRCLSPLSSRHPGICSVLFRSRLMLLTLLYSTLPFFYSFLIHVHLHVAPFFHVGIFFICDYSCFLLCISLQFILKLRSYFIFCSLLRCSTVLLLSDFPALWSSPEFPVPFGQNAGCKYFLFRTVSYSGRFSDSPEM